MKRTIVGLFARQLGLRLMKDIVKDNHYELKAVITHSLEPDMKTPRRLLPYYTRFCEQYKIPLYVVNKNQSGLDILHRFEPFDYLISNCYKYIIPNKYLSIAKLGSYNMHRSLLPKFPGLKPLLRALKAGEKFCGTTIHIMTEDVDEGRLVLQEKVPIVKGDTEAKLFKKIYPQQYRIMKQALKIEEDN